MPHYELDHQSQEDLHQQVHEGVDGVLDLAAHCAVTTAPPLVNHRSLGDGHDRRLLQEIDLLAETLSTAPVAHHQDLATGQLHLWMTFRACVHRFHETGLRDGTQQDLHHGNGRLHAQLLLW